VAIQLHRYQQNLINSQAKFIIVEKSRRIGISFALAYLAIQDAIESEMHTIFQSKDIKTGINFIDDCKRIIKQLNPKLIDGIENPYYIDYEATQSEIRIGDAKIFTVSSNPEASRGFGGNIFIDEAAFHPDFDLTLTAAQSCTDIGDGKVIVVSTHNGPATGFYALIQDIKNGKQKYWQHHFIDLTKAMEDGFHRRAVGQSKNHILKYNLLDKDFDEQFLQYMIEKCTSQESYDQEYLCKVTSAHNQLLSRKAIDACVLDGIELDSAFTDASGSLYAGLDIGLGDLTVLWILEEVWDDKDECNLYFTKSIHSWSKAKNEGITWTDIVPLVKPLLEHDNMFQIRVDCTGVGATIAQELEDEFGSIVEKVHFGTNNKREMIENMRKHIDKELVSLPNDKDVKEDLESFQIEWTKSGPKYIHGTKSSHGDFGIALMLALPLEFNEIEMI